MPTNKAEHLKALYEAKRRLCEAIKAATGEHVNPWETTSVMRALATQHFGPPKRGENSTAYFNRAACMTPKPQPSNRAGQKATAPDWDLIRRKPWRPALHLRQDDIDALPSGIPGGLIGNGFFMGREGRD